MADEEIVARLRLDVSEFDVSIEHVRDATSGLNKAAAETQGSLNNLSGSTGKLTDKMGALVAEEEAAAKAATDLAKSQDQAVTSSKALTTEVGKSQGILSKVREGFKQFGLGARDGFRTAIKEVGGFRGILSQTGGNIANFGKGAVNAFKGVGNFAGNALRTVGQGVISATSGIPVIGQLAAALGPVGIAAAGAAAGLFKVITNTDAGATAVQGLGVTAGVVFDRVTGLASSLFNEITNGTGIIGKSFDFLTGAVEFFLNKLTPIGDIFRALSETSLFQGLKEDFEFGQQIANQLDELDDKQRDVNLTVAQNEVGLRKNLAALRDTTKSAEERLKIAAEITATEQQNLRDKTTLLKIERGILETQAARQASAENGKGEVDDALKQQITDLNIAIANAEAESVSLTERVATRRAGIVEQEEQRKAAIRQKAIQAREKAEAEANKKAEIRAQAEAKLNETVAELARESFERTLTDAQKEVEAVKNKYADLEKATLEGIAKLREASPPNAQSEITAREAEAIIAIDKAKNEELAALEKARQEEAGKTRDEALERLRQSLLTSTELEREAVLVRLDEERALAEQNIENVTERNAVIAQLTQKAQEDLTKIVTDEEAKRLAQEQAAAEQRAQLAQTNANLIAGFAEQSLQTILTAAAQGQDIQEQASKQLLAILLDTLEKIILANAFQVQAISAGSPDPANVASGGTLGILRGVVLAGIVKALFGAAKAAITANYEGDPYVGGDGSKPMWSGRDGYLRRLDKGERVVRRKTNEANYDALEAMEDGNFAKWVRDNYAPLIGEDDRLVKYVNSDTGQRMAASLVLPKMFDKGIVTAVNGQSRQQRATNDLLSQLVSNTKPRRTNRRYN